MFKITATQVNWDGQGNDRSFHFTARNDDELAAKLHRIRHAYNPASTVITVNGERVSSER